MDYPFINLDKSTKPELIAHLRNFAGIEKPDTDKKDTLIEAILEFEENNQLTRPTELLPKAKQGEQIETENIKPSDDLNDYPKVEITINSSNGAGGHEDVLVWLNGRSFQMKRDQKVKIPEPVYRVLLDAKTVIGEQQSDGSVQNRVAQNYNITFHGHAM